MPSTAVSRRRAKNNLHLYMKTDAVLAEHHPTVNTIAGLQENWFNQQGLISPEEKTRCQHHLRPQFRMSKQYMADLKHIKY